MAMWQIVLQPLFISVQNFILFVATANGIENLQIVGRADKVFGVAALVQDFINIDPFQLQDGH
jgi:hypothetical protein